MKELKDLIVQPLSEEELHAASGGEEGERPQIRLHTRNGQLYQCPCGGIDFWVIGQNPSHIKVGCMKCGQEAWVSQTM